MRIIARRCTGIVALLGVVACSSPAGPREPIMVRIQVDPNPIPVLDYMDGTPRKVTNADPDSIACLHETSDPCYLFEVLQVKIANMGTRSVWLGRPCGIDVQQQVEGEWKSRGGGCPFIGMQPLEIRPGRVFTTGIQGWTEVVSAPREAGLYRVRFDLFAEDHGALPESMRTSDPFWSGPRPIFVEG